jgi:hypothetical protein
MTRREKFKEELTELFLRYGATLMASDHYKGYAECGEDIRMIIDLPGKIEDGNEIEKCEEIDLGSYFG